MGIEKDPCITVYPVTRLTNQRTSVPVIVKIGPEEVQVITVSIEWRVRWKNADR